MSFKCSGEYGCGKVQGSGSVPVHKVLKTRKKTYPARKYRHNKLTLEDPGGVGFETEVEAVLCQSCATTTEK